MQNLEKKLKNYFARRFGVEKSYWKSLKVFGRGNSIWVTSESVDLRDSSVACGIRALRTGGEQTKPTTYILQLLEDNIRRNIVELELGELKELLAEGKIIRDSLNPGYVALKYQGNVLGCGLRVSRALKCRIPRQRMKALQSTLDISED